MVEITNFDVLKYEQLYLNSQDSTEYATIIDRIKYDSSFSQYTKEAVHCLFCDRYMFHKGMLCGLLDDIQKSSVQDEVKLFINALYNFDRNKQSPKNITYLTPTDETPTDKLIKKYENGFPPQVFLFFKALLETPQNLNKFDIIAILGILYETKISADLNNFITQLIPVNQVSNEVEAKKIMSDNKQYEQSLFKQYIKSK